MQKLNLHDTCSPPANCLPHSPLDRMAIGMPVRFNLCRGDAMPAQDDLLIRVQSEWNGWRHAEVRLRDLENVHWFQPGPAPRPLVHGYIACTNVVAGEIPHDCDRTAPPHRLLVCVLKKHTLPSAFEELVRCANDVCALPAGVQASHPPTIAGYR